MIARLIPVNGGQPILIKKDVTVVGRKSDLCDIQIDKNSISKIHCVIIKTDGLLFVRDLCSTNGTRVNGQKIIRGALLPGDELSLASTKFEVELAGDPKEDDPEVGVHQRTEMLTAFNLDIQQEEEALDSDSENGSEIKLISE
ncbi:FHA domain-containing protein [Gimesia maris]|jgi:pSer/pThr/pTyr-binding forkhead associated (FHA) protein|uniref:FHA domain-containing protein n=1 Tax=Gimesia maris TaxID=122 RepID=A0A3D3RAK0_9PLAN|nr:FHA domain-containing protein [Gimesia maris]MAC55723.1 FHA domain-containing protein [Gimesia sp.]HAW31279.1 FHA domain-containing protein [Planctomycetaceae bacterium]QDT77729.1 Glycogen accumulation regulator GarA [Gimesia maris]QDU13392.1 Glycogen accumulation regulator GarA [Gimesia maris]QEG15319.1 Glycogen accumulation regulator GarA [Gimesia maris]|tara:strand:+ start:4905 stop:5333 length:429 start_codon:yes stop_codon:yes gene_type:complete